MKSMLALALVIVLASCGGSSLSERPKGVSVSNKTLDDYVLWAHEMERRGCRHVWTDDPCFDCENLSIKVCWEGK